MTTIFISHRRKDKGYAARGINDALCRKFGKRNVYFDLDSILFGLDWRKQIDEMLAQCDVMLVVIGDDWLEVNESGRSRLKDEDDLVHFEVSSALKRDIPVIPVLVGNASIPAKKALPDVLKPLHYRQAVEVRDDANFNAHIDKLLIGIEQVAPEPVVPSGRTSLLTWTIRIAPIVVVIVVIVGMAWQPLMDWVSKDEQTSTGSVDTTQPTASKPTLQEDQPQIPTTVETKTPAGTDTTDMEELIQNLVGPLGGVLPATSLAVGFHVPDLGVRIAYLTPEQSASTLGAMPAGAVVMEVESGRPMAMAGIQASDVVMSIGGKKIASEDDLRQALIKIGPGKTQFSYLRGGETKTVAVDCPGCKVE